MSAAAAGNGSSQTARNLAAVMVRPRSVMRGVLAQTRDRAAPWIIGLSVLAGMVDELVVSTANLKQAGQSISPVLLAGVVVAGCAAAALVGLLIWYLLSWGAWVVGRLFDGTASVRAVRSALAWGLVPTLWALLYRIPAAFVFRGLGAAGSPTVRIGEDLALTPGVLSAGCGVSLLHSLVELSVVLWCLAVMSHTLAEAEGFAPLQGLATLLLTLASPAIIGVAAAIAFS